MLNKLKKKQPHISLPMPVKPASCDEVGILTEAGKGEAVDVLEGSSKSRHKGKGRKRSFVPKCYEYTSLYYFIFDFSIFFQFFPDFSHILHVLW
jgi:hypothetical protein